MDFRKIKKISIPEMPNVNEVRVNGVTVWRKKQQRLPEGFTEVRWLILHNNTYFNTLVKTANNVSMSGEFSTNVYGVVLIGARYTTSTAGFCFGYFSRSAGRSGYYVGYTTATNQYYTDAVNLTDGNIHTFLLNPEGLFVDEISLQRPYKSAASQFYDIYLGSWNSNNTTDTRYWSGRLGEWIIAYDEVEQWHGIPCTDPGGRPCYYDIISQSAFYDVNNMPIDVERL